MLRYFTFWLGTFVIAICMFLVNFFVIPFVANFVYFSPEFLDNYAFVNLFMMLMLPGVVLFDFLVRLFKNNNPFNGVTSLRLTLRMRQLLQIDKQESTLIDDLGQKIKITKTVHRMYMSAVNHLTVNVTDTGLIFKVDRPVNADAQKELEKRFDVIRQDLSSVVPNLVLSAPESVKQHYIISGEISRK